MNVRVEDILPHCLDVLILAVFSPLLHMFCFSARYSDIIGFFSSMIPRQISLFPSTIRRSSY
jgi:hypothetical protein